MKNNRISRLVISAMLLAIGLVLPFLTGQIPEICSMLLPLHLPALICGFVCGWPWGLAVGLIAPVLRSFTLGMPPMYPTAVCMAFELAAYGSVSGLMHRLLPRKKGYIYCSLLTAMVAGRLVWGGAMYVALGIKGGAFTFSAFMAGAVVNALPGIIVQIVLIPIVVMLLERARGLQTGLGADNG